MSGKNNSSVGPAGLIGSDYYLKFSASPIASAPYGNRTRVFDEQPIYNSRYYSLQVPDARQLDLKKGPHTKRALSR